MFFLNPPSENTYPGYLDFKDCKDVYVKPILNPNYSLYENTYLGYLDFKDFKDVFLNPPSTQTYVFMRTHTLDIWNSRILRMFFKTHPQPKLMSN